jgi:enamine deaminase RidA (YjgF/YER057c/UK114 family)
MCGSACGTRGRITGVSEVATLVPSTELSGVAEYAYAAVVAGGSRLVFTAGARPLTADGATFVPGDVQAQADQVVVNLRTTLNDAGASLTDVVHTTVYVASNSQRDLVAAWEVVRDWLAPHRRPSTLLGVAVLGHEHQLVEVDAVAAPSRLRLRSGRTSHPAARWASGDASWRSASSYVVGRASDVRPLIVSPRHSVADCSFLDMASSGSRSSASLLYTVPFASSA